MPTNPVQEADDYAVRLAAKRRFIERLEREASARREPTEAEMQAIMQEIDDEREAIYQKNLALKALKQEVSKRLTKVSESTKLGQFALKEFVLVEVSEPTKLGQLEQSVKSLVEVLEKKESSEVKTQIQRTEAEINPIQALPKQEWKGGKA